jgi:hypothetical protein
MKKIAVVMMIALGAGNAACTTTGKRVGGAAVGGVFGAAVAGPVGCRWSCRWSGHGTEHRTMRV